MKCCTLSFVLVLLCLVGGVGATNVFGQRSQEHQATFNEAQAFKKALHFVQRSEFDPALNILTGLVNRSPKKALFWFNLGNVYYLKGMFSQALNCYARVSTLKSPLAPAAQLYSAKSFRQLKEFESSRAILLSLSERQLPKHLADEIKAEREELSARYLEAAFRSFQAEDFQYSLRLTVLSQSLAASTEAETLRGMVLYRLGKLHEAEEALKQSILSAPSHEKREELRRLLVSLRSGRLWVDSRDSLAVTFTGGYSSNVEAVTSLQSPADTPTSKLALDYIHQLKGMGDLGAAVGGSAFVEELWHQPSERRAKVALFGYGGKVVGAFNVYLIPRVQVETRGTSLYLLQGAAGILTERQFGDDQLSFSIHHLRALSLDESLPVLSGTTESVSGQYVWNQKSSSFGVGFLGSIENYPDIIFDSGVLPVAAKSVGPNLFAVLRGDRWQAHGRFSYQLRMFDQLAEPGAEQRTDREVFLELGGEHDIGVDTKIFFIFDLLGNGSTLGKNSVDDRNYAQWNTKAGIAWQIK